MNGVFATFFGLLVLVAIGKIDAGVGEFPQIDVEAEKELMNQVKKENGGATEGAVLQIIDVPPRREECKPGMKFIEGRCRKVFMVGKNRTVRQQRPNSH